MDRNKINLADLQMEVRVVNEANGWFDKERSVGDDIALLHSEVSEMYEAFRNNDRNNFCEEAADILIRLLDTCERHAINLERETLDKLERNRGRGYRHGGKAV